MAPTNKLSKYVFVFKISDNSFPEKWKIVENDSEPSNDEPINGHLQKQDLNKKQQELESRYPGNEYRVCISYANTWRAIENNYRGLMR